MIRLYQLTKNTEREIKRKRGDQIL